MGRMKNLLGVLLALLLVVAGAGIAGAAPKAVIDRSHGQTVDLSGFASVLVSSGWDVVGDQVDEIVPLTTEVLNTCNLLVVPQPMSSLADSYDAIVAYVKAGGGLLVLGEAYGPELTAFQAEFGVRFNPDMVYSYEFGSENFSVRLPLDPAYLAYSEGGCDPDLSYDQVYNPILDRVTSLLYNGGCSLSVDANKVGFAVRGGCLDIAEVEQSFPPLLAATTLESGRAVFLGDTDALTANQQLLDNIVSWAQKPEEETGTIQVTIAIRPWNPHNIIDLNSKGFVRVAVLTASDPKFDVKDVDPKSVEFMGAKPLFWLRMDVDRDRDKDLLLLFWVPNLKFPEGANEAVLTGKTLEGKSFEGKDTVQIVQHKKCKKPEKPDNKGNNCGGTKGK